MCVDDESRALLNRERARIEMDKSEDELLLELWDAAICPNCGKQIPEGTRIGTGRRSDGGFCSLDCYAKFHLTALQERAVHVAAIQKRHQDS